MSNYKKIKTEIYERDLHVKRYAVLQLIELDLELTQWLDDILNKSGEVAAKVDIELYRKLKSLRDRVRSVL